MSKTFLTAYAFWCASLLPLPVRAANYTWDNGSGDGTWNNPINWSQNVAPTATDGAIFSAKAGSGVVTFTGDATAQYIRQLFGQYKRTFTIDPSATADHTLTLSGTGAALIDCWIAGENVTFDGTPNANGARLKMQIDGSGTATNVLATVALTLTISCDVSGAGGFILRGGEAGPGRLILSGANTYTGPTTTVAGTLLVNGSTAAASPVTIGSGTILGGTGVINGPVTVASGGTLSPGNSVGTLTVNNNLTLGGGMLIEVNKALSPSNDMVTVSGTLTNSGVGTVQVINLGAPLATGDSFRIFNKPLLNGQALLIVSAGTEVWTNKLAIDGTIAVLAATNPPVTGNPTRVFNWKGAAVSNPPWVTPMQIPANWMENQAPPLLSSNILVFQGDILVPYNWPYIDGDYGTSILIFSNNVVLNSIKINAGFNHTMKLGSYVRQDTAIPCYFGITGSLDIKGADGNWYRGVTVGAYFTNTLGDVSCGSQTEFQCVGGRLDVYGVLIDGAGAHSRLVKSGNNTLALTGDLDLGNDANKYTGGTIVNAGPIKMGKMAGVNCIPGDVTVNGTGALIMNTGGEQIADSAVVTLNHYGSLSLAGQPETVAAVQGPSANASVSLGGGTLTVAPLAGVAYNGGIGESDFAGSVNGSGTIVKNGTGTYGMLGVNSATTLTVNGGTLKLNGNSGTGAVTINSGGTLLGQGTIAGAVTVAAGGTIGAGFSAGLLTLPAGLNMSAGGNGATNAWELAALKDSSTGVAGTDFDQIVLTGGTLALGAQAAQDIRFTGSATAPNASNPFWQSPHTWRIILLSGGSNPGASNFGRIKNGTYAAGKFTTAADGTGILLTFMPNAAPPRITAITGAGTGSVKVSYTNTLAGTNYVLSCCTNLNNPMSWYPLGTRTATGTGDSQTDNSATTSQRYYRVYYP